MHTRHTLYTEDIIRHSQDTTHHGTLNNATHSAEGYNQVCGDFIKISAIVDADAHITAIKYAPECCAISKASASLMVPMCIHKSADDIEQLADELPNNLNALKSINDFPARLTCVTLPWKTLLAALRGEKEYNA